MTIERAVFAAGLKSGTQSDCGAGIVALSLVFRCRTLLRKSHGQADEAAFDLDANRDGGVAYISQDAAHPDDVWIATDRLHSHKRVTSLNPQIEQMQLATSRLVDWNSVDGQPLHGALPLPVGYEPGRRYPMIVNVCDGVNLSDGVFHFSLVGSGVDNLQILAARGYAVLAPDAPCRRAHARPSQDRDARRGSRCRDGNRRSAASGGPRA
jgi:dipeptidyl aminopeptidase/acylaminoacyl peptidase